MGFPGVWMTKSATMAYRVIPKCACSTVGQIMYYSDNGGFYDGDIHDADAGIHKWGFDASKPIIEEAVRGGVFTFTCVRNPWTRILSSFFDKIAGVQRSGTRYRENLIPGLVRKYGVDVEGDFDQIRAFRHFLLFARDTIRFGKPMDPDLHWSAIASHAATLRANGGKYDFIFPIEDFDAGMQTVLDRAGVTSGPDLASLPRFNESEGHGPKRAFPVEDYFDDLSVFLMHEVYRRDFNLFRYGRDPYSGPPRRDLDIEEINTKLVSRSRD